MIIEVLVVSGSSHDWKWAWHEGILSSNIMYVTSIDLSCYSVTLSVVDLSSSKQCLSHTLIWLCLLLFCLMIFHVLLFHFFVVWFCNILSVHLLICSTFSWTFVSIFIILYNICYLISESWYLVFNFLICCCVISSFFICKHILFCHLVYCQLSFCSVIFAFSSISLHDPLKCDVFQDVYTQTLIWNPLQTLLPWFIDVYVQVVKYKPIYHSQ